MVEEWLLVWAVFGFFIWVIWGLCVGDPGSSRVVNIIMTVFVAVIALPTTIILAVIVGIIILILKKRI